MTLKEGQDEFIQTWGTLGSKWGINRTMAQIHALLLISPHSLSADEIMTKLKISRGNVNMNTRELIDWGIVKKELKAGERKEYFLADKDIWNVIKKIIKERRRRELEPVIQALEELKNIEGDPQDPHYQQYQATMNDLQKYTSTGDRLLKQLTKADEGWIMGPLFKFFVKR